MPQPEQRQQRIGDLLRRLGNHEFAQRRVLAQFTQIRQQIAQAQRSVNEPCIQRAKDNRRRSGHGRQHAGIINTMTQDLFRTDAYLRQCTATVTAISAQGIVLDRSVFYPLGGGQGGDTGALVLADGSELAIIDTRKGKTEDGSFNSDICHLPNPDVLEQLLNQERRDHAPVAVGDTVTARIDWARRHRLMRLHTTTHLLCHLVPQLVNGCSITPDYARLDFNMTDALDKEALTAGIAQLVAADTR